MPSEYKPKTTQLPAKYQPGFVGRLDGRTELVKRLEDAYQGIIEDCGGGDDMTHLRLSLIERAVFLEFQLRKWEEMILVGTLPEETFGRWVQGCNALLGLSKVLGLSRSKIASQWDRFYSEDPDKPPSTQPNGESARKGRKTRKPKQALRIDVGAD